MPVRELTERPTIPRLGKIRLGDRSGRNGAPVNKPFFVCPPEVQEVYGPEPTELHVVFLTDDLERIASQYYRAYNASNGLVCKGDGYNADALLDVDELRKSAGVFNVNSWAHGDTPGRPSATKTLQRQAITCAGGGYEGLPPCPMFAAKKCSVRTFLQFAIRDVPGLGVYQMDTGSIVSTLNINGVIEITRSLLGGVAGVPMILRRAQKDVAPPPEMIKKKVWMVELVVDTQYSLANLIELHRGPVVAALLPPVDESETYLALGDGQDDDEPGVAQEQVAAPSEARRGAAREESVTGTEPAPAPPPSATMAEWLALVAKGRERFGLQWTVIVAHIKATWPETVDGDDFVATRLSPEHVDEAAAYLRDYVA